MAHTVTAVVLAALCCCVGHAAAAAGPGLRGQPSSAGTGGAMPINPNDAAPALAVPTLSGTFSYNPASSSNAVPLIVVAYDANDALSQAMWTDSSSVQDMLAILPNSTSLLFASYGNEPSVVRQPKPHVDGHRSSGSASDSDGDDKLEMPRAGDGSIALQQVKALQAMLSEQIAAMPAWSSERKAAVEARLHYATVPVADTTAWLPHLLANWTRPTNQLRVNFAAESLLMSRLDSEFAWLEWPEYVNKSLVLPAGGFDDSSCSFTGDTASLKGELLLLGPLDVESLACSYFQIANATEAVGAAGAILFPQPGQPVQVMNCAGSDCDVQLTVSLTMVSNAGGMALQELLQPAGASPGSATYVTNTTSGFYMSITAQGTLHEVGWILSSNARQLAWEAQWLDYKTGLLAELAEPALVVPIVPPTIMHGAPIVVNVTLPDYNVLQSKFNHVQLDFSLSCPGRLDRDCAIWDHTVELHVCCDNVLCGQELGRWTTPFRRRVGRWLTDIDAWFPVFDTGPGKPNVCTFTLQTVPWAKPWLPSLNLRFSQSSAVPSGDLVPLQYMPLFIGADKFDSTYNDRQPIVFSQPAATTLATLTTVIGGHGDDEFGCGEFCITSHHFTVNGHENVRTFGSAGTALGCAELVSIGGIPNEHGTWLYGRDGWCDGNQVFPESWDVTDQLLVDGMNTITYRGLFEGHTPNPKTDSAYMRVLSFLTFYGKSE